MHEFVQPSTSVNGENHSHLKVSLPDMRPDRCLRSCFAMTYASCISVCIRLNVNYGGGCIIN